MRIQQRAEAATGKADPRGEFAAALPVDRSDAACRGQGPDPTPENWTSLECEFSQNPGQENSNERNATQSRVDHRDPEARRSGVDDAGVMSPARDLRADLPPLEGEVRRDGQRRGQAVEATGRGEP